MWGIGFPMGKKKKQKKAIKLLQLREQNLQRMLTMQCEGKSCKPKCCKKYKKCESKRCKKCPCKDLLKKSEFKLSVEMVA